MRRLMRNALLLVVFVVLALLALGALPSYLGSGTSYSLEVSPSDDDGTALNATGISERRYPYLTEALAADDGRSSGYQRGLGGLKGWFTHSPFDEYDAIAQLEPKATRAGGDRLIIEYETERYAVELVSTSGDGDD